MSTLVRKDGEIAYDQRFQIGPLLGVFLQALVDKVLEAIGEGVVFQLRRRFVDDVVEQLEDGHRFRFDDVLAGRAVVSLFLEDVVQHFGIRWRDRVHSDGHFDQRQSEGPDVRLNRVVSSLQAFRLEWEIRLSRYHFL